MNLYANYLKEREGLELIDMGLGFITYKFRGPDCYIQDIYVLPDYRKDGYAKQMADSVVLLAKEKGIRVLTGSVDSNANGATDSEKVLLAYGMRPYITEGSVIYYSKEIL